MPLLAGLAICGGAAPGVGPGIGPDAAPVLPTLYLATAEGRLGYDDTGGAGPLVIALPGMGDVRREYRYLTPYLTAVGDRVVTVDLRGFGDSSAVWSDYSPRAIGGDLLRLESRLGRTSAVLIGNSYSAGAVAWAAHDAPRRVSAIVWLGPVLRDPAPPPPWYGRAAMWLAFAGPWRVRLWLDYWDGLFTSRTPPDQASYRSALARDLSEPGRMAALDAMLHTSKASTAAIVPGLTAPVLVVIGTKDPDFDDPADEAAWIAGRTGAQLRMIPDAGHYPHAEMPERVGPLVVDFLRSANKP